MGRYLTTPSYSLGYGVKAKVDKYVQLVKFFQSAGVGPLLHGSRNPAVRKEIQGHFPKLYDAPNLALEKIGTGRELYRRSRAIELHAAGMTRGEAAAEGTPP